MSVKNVFAKPGGRAWMCYQSSPIGCINMNLTHQIFQPKFKSGRFLNT